MESLWSIQGGRRPGFCPQLYNVTFQASHVTSQLPGIILFSYHYQLCNVTFQSSRVTSQLPKV
ncbi:hypothetical protein E2C01_080440 [Portunus trituberculatus]|uniref:Uncharacterized protein n=1 Tax=Portunus trituberculatus TaxID=210409 RepID=A0A5B7IYF2_PORTR|nr:hypothetical protein [Portunus trituberculatus]